MTVSFVLANCQHGAMIVNRLDYNKSFGNQYYGVGHQILNHGAFDPDEVAMLKDLLNLRREHYGLGVVVMDCGANIGVHAVELAHHLRGWGELIAIEAQERIFYALAGNLALHNCYNARAVWAAVDAEDGWLDMPEPDYTIASSFGSFELKERLGTEYIGQPIDYGKPRSRVRRVTIDNAGLTRLDLLKLDVEGMELEALDGAKKLIEACKPMLFVETIKLDKDEFKRRMDAIDYRTFGFNLGVLALHRDDKVAPFINVPVVEEADAA